MTIAAAIIFIFSFDTTPAQRLAAAPPPLRQTASQPAKKIQWQNNIWGAYTMALNQNKPLVAYFHMWNGEYCRKLENGPLASPEVNSLADKAIFVRVDIDMDDNHKNVASKIRELNLKEYPAVVVMDVYKDRLVERGRIIGYFDTPEFYGHLNPLLLKK
jgi:hypothetical protein